MPAISSSSIATPAPGGTASTLKSQSNSSAGRRGEGPPFASLLRLTAPGATPHRSPLSQALVSSPPAGESTSSLGSVLNRAERQAPREDPDEGRDSLVSLPDDLLLNGMTRLLAMPASTLQQLPGGHPPEADAVTTASRISLEQVLSRLVRRIAWSGDARGGSAHLEIGAGALEGATLTIHADQGALRVALQLPPGADAAEWRERIARRLGVRGLQLAELEVG